MDALHTHNLYKDIQSRTGGEIYIGVVGPVRTGKSTFIKRFMDIMVLPYMTQEHEKVRGNIIFPGDFPKASVTGNDNPYSGMVIDYFPCADFRSLSERDFIRRPGGFYHPFRIFFHVAAGAIHHIAHTVNKAYIHIDVIIQCDFGRFFRN